MTATRTTSDARPTTATRPTSETGTTTGTWLATTSTVPRTPRRRATAALLAGLVAAVITGCATGADPDAPGVGAQPATTAQNDDAEPADQPADPTDQADGPTDAEIAEAAAHPVAVVAPGVTQVGVHTAPGDATPVASLPDTTPLGAPLHLRVLEATPDGQWLRVRIPARPNGSDGWVSADEVTVVAVRHHISVDLSDRELVLREDGEPVLTATVAIGTPDNPTPTGRFFVTDKLTADPDGAYGAYALGLSAWSPTLSEFAGGDGQVGLHGTNRPDLLGEEVSHGCVRVSNDVVTELAAVLPLGVPVDITA